MKQQTAWKKWGEVGKKKKRIRNQLTHSYNLSESRRVLFYVYRQLPVNREVGGWGIRHRWWYLRSDACTLTSDDDKCLRLVICHPQKNCNKSRLLSKISRPSLCVSWLSSFFLRLRFAKWKNVFVIRVFFFTAKVEHFGQEYIGTKTMQSSFVRSIIVYAFV